MLGNAAQLAKSGARHLEGFEQEWDTAAGAIPKNGPARVGLSIGRIPRAPLHSKSDVTRSKNGCSRGLPAGVCPRKGLDDTYATRLSARESAFAHPVCHPDHFPERLGLVEKMLQRFEAGDDVEGAVRGWQRFSWTNTQFAAWQPVLENGDGVVRDIDPTRG